MEKNVNPFDDGFREALDGYRDMPGPSSWEEIEKKLDQDDLSKARRQQTRLKRYLLLLLLLSGTLSVLLFREWGNNNQYTATRPDTSNYILDDNNKSLNQTTEIEQNKSTKEPSTLITANKESVSKIAGNSRTAAPEHTKASAEKTTRPENAHEETIGISRTIAHSKNSRPDQTAATNERSFTSDRSNKLEQTDNGGPLVNGITHTPKKTKSIKRRTNASFPIMENENHTINTEILSDATPVTSDRTEMSKKPFVSMINPVAALGKNMTELADRLSMRSLVSFTGKKKKRFDVLSVAPFYSIESGSQELHDGRREHREDDRDLIERGEEFNATAQKGLMVNWNLNNQWGLVFGISQTGKNTTINPRDLFARPDQSSGGEIKYKVSCSAGTAYIPAKVGTPAPAAGDSLRGIESNIALRYISIPAAIRYAVHLKKFELGVLAGPQINLLAKNQATINYWDPSGAKNQVQVAVQGPKSMYLSGLFGLSGEYLLTDKIRIFLMPTQQFSIGAINRNSPTETKSRSLGYRMGISVGLK